MTARPAAAKGTFPYPHRTVAEIDACAGGITTYCRACKRWQRLWGCEHIECPRALGLVA